MQDQPRTTAKFQMNGAPLKALPEAVLERRATDHFESTPIPEETLDGILRLALQAPSGYNLQPWRFIVVRDEANRRRLMQAAYGQPKVGEAPVVVIAVGMTQDWKNTAHEVFDESVRRGAGRAETIERYKDGAFQFLSGQKMDVWVTRHTMIAYTLMMIAAEVYGVDTAPMEGFDPAAVKREFDVPEEGEVVALLAMGRAKAPDRPYPGRFPVERVVFSERFGAPFAARHHVTV